MIPKFRTWNSEAKEIEVFKTYEEISELFLALSADDGFYSIMQSTGLFDKNGKEIFEGDIIAIEVDDTEAPINAKIFQNSKIGMLMFHVFEDNEDVPMVELLEDNSVAFAVIGNIYENKELLDA